MDQAPVTTLGRLSRASLQILLIAAAVALVIFVVVHLRLVFIPVILALFAATFLQPVARFLRGRSVPNALAALLALVLGVGVLALIVMFLAPRVAYELGPLAQSVQSGANEVGNYLERAFGLTDVQLDQAIDEALTTIQAHSGTITRGLLSGALLVGEVLAGLLLLLVILFFMLKDGDEMWEWAVDLFPPDRTQVDVRELGRRAWRTLTGYIRGLAIVATVDSVLIGAGLAVLGVPLVLPLAVLTFMAAFFPLIGAFTAGLIAALVALVAKGWVVALVVVAIITVVQQLEGDIIYPVVVGRAISLHPLAILLAVTSGAVAGGIVGALLAPPIVAVFWTIVSYLRREAPLSAAS
ncbi:MAG: putative heme transporter [Thermoleophilaceae bacterium]|jgi:predicted PurR-regulated permease PerM|nr:putative heme transporter [Thermoleophilaceae bacterium]